MSLSNEWTYWHLTPTGWKIGDQKKDFKDLMSIPPPRDTVLTCKYRVYQSCSFKEEENECIEISRDMNQMSLIDLLLKQFGNCPQKLNQNLSN